MVRVEGRAADPVAKIPFVAIAVGRVVLEAHQQTGRIDRPGKRQDGKVAATDQLRLDLQKLIARLDPEQAEARSCLIGRQADDRFGDHHFQLDIDLLAAGAALCIGFEQVRREIARVEAIGRTRQQEAAVGQGEGIAAAFAPFAAVDAGPEYVALGVGAQRR